MIIGAATEVQRNSGHPPCKAAVLVLPVDAGFAKADSRAVSSRRAGAQEQTTSDAALRRQPARERFSIPSGTPAQLPAPAPTKSSGQPGWLLASLGVLAAVLALAGGLAVLAARRAGRRARVGHAA
jgi:hypothetical protein